MRRQFSYFALAAGFVLALAFTFGCSSDDGGGDGGKIPSSPSEAVSSSSFLIGLSSSSLLPSECLYSGVCIPIAFETCLSIGGQVVEICPVASSSSFVSSSSNSSAVASSSSKAVFSSSSISSNSSISVVLGPSVSYGDETYQTVVIGTQTWFKRNLNYNVEGSECYNNDPANCATYGRLYNWETARKVCPSGWHLPSNAEWDTLIGDNYSTAGTELKAKSGWSEDRNGTDNYGFSALPGGRGNSDGTFGTIGYRGNWWSATEFNASDAYFRYMYYVSKRVEEDNNLKSFFYSVRCVKD